MKLINKYINKIINDTSERVINEISKIVDEKFNVSIDEIKKALGRIETRQIKTLESNNIQDYEFKVFSQWGEDGIIQHLINKLPTKNKIFVEFGVENYRESNTRFLLQNNNWSGLVIDGSQANIDYIKSDQIYWKYNLKAECAFITKDNINEIIKNAGISDSIGLLSVDIDGNDYWVWEAMDCISPDIVICEYNSLFGAESKVVIPYEANYERFKKNYSGQYFGASIAAFDSLAKQKGYFLVGSNSAGNNLFFVKDEYIDLFKKLSPQDAYVKYQYRESRDSNGNLNYLSFNERLNEIKDMEIIDLNDNKLKKVSEIIKV